MTSYDTSARRGVLTKKVNDRVADVIIDIEEALDGLPHSGKTSLLDKIEGVLAGVAADPAGVASGRVPLALGAASPAPGTTTPSPVDPVQLITDFATAQGFDPGQISRLLGAIDAHDPHTVESAINGALGQMVPRTDLTTAESQRTAMATRLAEVEASMGMTTGSLGGRDWQRQLDAAKAALAGTPPPPTGTPTAAETALNGALGGLSRSRGRDHDKVNGRLPQSVIDTWVADRGL